MTIEVVGFSSTYRDKGSGECKCCIMKSCSLHRLPANCVFRRFRWFTRVAQVGQTRNKRRIVGRNLLKKTVTWKTQTEMVGWVIRKQVVRMRLDVTGWGSCAVTALMLAVLTVTCLTRFLQVRSSNTGRIPIFVFFLSLYSNSETVPSGRSWQLIILIRRYRTLEFIRLR
jgi:hypothetical protein